jgi:diaminopropionate ammonia-lyase
VIFVHGGVSRARVAAIERYGAEVRRVAGNYDDSVRHAARVAAERGWTVVSDTSYAGYTDIPRDVMQGYAVLAHEALEQMRGEPPTHVFVQGGVGGLAAAVAAYFWERFGARRPHLTVIEPDRADCLLRSARAGSPQSVGGDLDTVMAGLACGEPSLLAWQILRCAADAFASIPDDAALDAMRRLAAPPAADPPIVGGESGVAGLAGLIALASDSGARARLGLGAASSVFVIGSEGDTDPELYARIVGRTAAQVLASRRAA